MSDQESNPSKGRPTDYSEEVVSILETSFKNGLTLEQSCDRAGIRTQTYYNWERDNKEFADRMHIARRWLSSLARDVLTARIKEGDLRAAQFFLARRDPDFKEKTEVEHHDADLEKHRKKIKEFLNDTPTGNTQPESDQEATQPVESVS